MFLSRVTGGWRDATSELPQLNDYTHTAAIGDVSGRGINDIFVGNSYPGQERHLSYLLLNSGTGQFTLSRTGIAVGSGESLDTRTAHMFPGATLTDLDADGLPELIVTADRSVERHQLRRTTILWNRAGTFSETSKTMLTEPAVFTSSHMDLDVQAADFNGDGQRDLILAGAPGRPYYDGWFVQIFINRGDRQFTDETANLLSPADSSGGTEDVATNTPWAQWVRLLDFNHDGRQDFAVVFNGARGVRQPSLPLVWLNGRDGRFTTLKVSDFVRPGREWQVAGGELVQTRNGFSFITPQYGPTSNGLVITGLAATRPYRSP